MRLMHKNAIKLKNKAPPLKCFKNRPPPELRPKQCMMAPVPKFTDNTSVQIFIHETY